MRLGGLLTVQILGMLVTGIAIGGMMPVPCPAQDQAMEVMQENSGESPNTQQADQPEDFPTPFYPPPGTEDEVPWPSLNLETLLPLKVLMSPLHWGAISLLSFSAYEGYSSNPQFEKIPLGSSVTALSGLLLYAHDFSGWNVYFQYLPFVWISPARTFKSFSAFSADLRKTQRLNNNWRWGLADRVHYSPTQATEAEPGFVASSSGFTLGDAFLSTGRNVFANGASTSLTDQYAERSSLSLQSSLSFIHLSGYIGSQSGGNLPGQHAVNWLSGIVWRRQYSETSGFVFGYRYGIATSSNIAAVQTESLDFGWNHRLSQTWGVSAVAGPAWSSYGSTDHNNASRGSSTVHGSVALSKSFRAGGVVLQASRNNGFSGVISNRFYNRFDINAHRAFTPRLESSVSASYLQQQLSDLQHTTGKLAFTETQYALSRNWSIFGQARYLKLMGNQRFSGVEISGMMGFRWTWVPDKP